MSYSFTDYIANALVTVGIDGGGLGGLLGTDVIGRERKTEETTIVRTDYLDSILRQLDTLREEVKRLRPPIKDYKIDAAAWNAERETSGPRKHWIDTVDYRKHDPWGSI